MMRRRKSRQNEIPIQMEDVEIILGKEFHKLSTFLSTVFCPHCSGMTTIENYTIFLDDNHDVIFDGQCITCRQPVSRYIETGVLPPTEPIAKHIRMIKTEFGTRHGEKES